MSRSSNTPCSNPSTAASTAGGGPALTLEVDCKRFGGREVVRGLSLRAAAGEFVALVGPSGCGKTTTLTIAAGLDTAFEGRVEWAGGAPPVLGYVFQTPRLLPWRTVRENLRLVLPPDRRTSPAIDALLEEMELAEAADRHPTRLSLGMARRAALARAFVVEPDLLLMDEPFVSLDELTAQRLRALLLERLERRPATVLFVTHNLREAIQLADRIVVMAPAPTRVVAEVVAPGARGRRDEADVEAFRTALLARPEPAFRVLA